MAAPALARRPRVTLLRASVLLLMVASVSKLTTVAADSYVAARFGLSAGADAYLVAVGLVGVLLAAPGETVRLALVPVVGEHLRDGRPREAAGVLAWLLTALLLGGATAAAALAVAAPWAARLAAPGFDATAVETLTLLIRVLSPALALGLVMAVFTGALHAQLRFSGPAVAGIGLGLGVVCGGAVWGDRLGVTSLAAGYVAGMTAVVAALGWLARDIVGHGIAFAGRARDLRRVARLALPTGLAISVVSAGAVIERAIASATGAGNVAALAFAIKLMTQAGIISQSLWTPLTPLLAASPKAGEQSDGRLTRFSLRLVLLVLIPVTALLIALRQPLVALIYERGAFTAGDTARTSTLLALHSGSIVGEGLFMISVAALLAMHDAATRLIASGLLIVSKVALSFALLPAMGAGAVALAASVSSLIAAAYAVHVLARTLGPGALSSLLVCAAKAAAAGLLALLAAALGARVAAGMDGVPPQATAVAQLAAGGFAGMVAYVIALMLLGVDEARLGFERLRARLGRA